MLSVSNMPSISQLHAEPPLPMVRTDAMAIVPVDVSIASIRQQIQIIGSEVREACKTQRLQAEHKLSELQASLCAHNACLTY